MLRASPPTGSVPHRIGGDGLAFGDFLKSDFLGDDIIAALDEGRGAILQLSNALGEKINQQESALYRLECLAEQFVLAHRKTLFLLPSSNLTRGAILGVLPPTMAVPTVLGAGRCIPQPFLLNKGGLDLWGPGESCMRSGRPV
jgi:hypothetical protein